MSSAEKKLSARESELMCRSMFSLSKIACSKFSHLTERALDFIILDAEKANEIKKMRSRILQTLVL